MTQQCQDIFKVYKCKFQLQLFQLRIALRFVCKFFIQFKSSNGKKSVKTLMPVQNSHGKAIFNQKLLLQLDMVRDNIKNQWLRKDTIISVFFISKNKPNNQQLAGRITISMNQLCQQNIYDNVQMALSYSSCSKAQLKFTLKVKQQKKSTQLIANLDATQFKDRLSIFNNLSRTKSQSIISLNSVKQLSSKQFIDTPKKTKQQQTQQRTQRLTSSESLLKMTLRNVEQCMTKQNYQAIVKKQSKLSNGTDKVMFIPQLVHHNSKQDLTSNLNNSNRSHLTNSIVNIEFVSQNLSHMQLGDSLQFTKTKSKNYQSLSNNYQSLSNNYQSLSDNYQSLKIDSSNGAGLFHNVMLQSVQQVLPINNIKHTHDVKHTNSQNVKQTNIQNIKQTNTKNKKIISQEIQPQLINLRKQLRQTRTKLELQQKINQINCQKLKQVSSQLTQVKRKSSLLQSSPKLSQIVKLKQQVKQLESLKQQVKQIKSLKQQLKSLKSLKQQLNTLKSLKQQVKTLKQLKQEKKIKTQTKQQKLLREEIMILKSKIVKIEKDNFNIGQKLNKRDDIQLLNQLKIQQLEEQLKQYKLNSIQKHNPKSTQTIKLQNKINQLEQEIFTISIINRDNEIKVNNFMQKQTSIKQTLQVIESQFKRAINDIQNQRAIILQKDQQYKLLRQSISLQKSDVTKMNRSNSAQKITLKIQDKNVLFFQNPFSTDRIETQNEITKSTLKQYSNLLRIPQKGDYELGIIKQEDSYRSSRKSSVHAQSGLITTFQQQIILKYKQALKFYYAQKKITQPLQLDFQPTKLRTFTFNEFQRVTKIIIQLCEEINSLIQQVDTKALGNKTLKKQLNQIQQKFKKQKQAHNMTNQVYLKPQDLRKSLFSSVPVKKMDSLKSEKSQKCSNFDFLTINQVPQKNYQHQIKIVSNQHLKPESEVKNAYKVNSFCGKQVDPDDFEQVYYHDILDLQIRLNKQKQQKGQIMEQLQLRKSINRSQQTSQYSHHPGTMDILQISKQLKSIIQARISQSNSQFVNILSRQVQIQDNKTQYKQIYRVEQKSRNISKQLIKMKSSMLKLNIKNLQPMRFKNIVLAGIKPCQQAVDQLLQIAKHITNQI